MYKNPTHVTKKFWAKINRKEIVETKVAFVFLRYGLLFSAQNIQDNIIDTNSVCILFIARLFYVEGRNLIKLDCLNLASLWNEEGTTNFGLSRINLMSWTYPDILSQFDLFNEVVLSWSILFSQICNWMEYIWKCSCSFVVSNFLLKKKQMLLLILCIIEPEAISIVALFHQISKYCPRKRL